MLHFATFAKIEFMSKKRRGKKSGGISAESAKEQVLAVICKNPQKEFNYKQISKGLI